MPVKRFNPRRLWGIEHTRRFGMDGIVFNPAFFTLDWSSQTRLEGGLSSSLKIQTKKSKYENATDDERKSDEMVRGRQVRTGTRPSDPGQCGGISGDEPFGVEWRRRFLWRWQQWRRTRSGLPTGTCAGDVTTKTHWATAGISTIIDGAHSILAWPATSNQRAARSTTMACWTLSVKRLRTHRWRMRLKWVVF